jgi:hypothetical protein
VDQFLDFLENVASLIGIGVRKLLAIIALAFACGIAFLLQSVKFDLSLGSKTIWVSLLAWIGIWCGTLTFRSGKAGKIVLTMSALTLASITLSHYFPGTSKGASKVVTHQDKKNLERAQALTLESVRPFPCDKTYAEKLVFFAKDGSTGQRVARIHYLEGKDGRIQCYNQSGIDAFSGEETQPVTPEVVTRISTQEPVSPPPPPPLTAQDVERIIREQLTAQRAKQEEAIPGPTVYRNSTNSGS